MASSLAVGDGGGVWARGVWCWYGCASMGRTKTDISSVAYKTPWKNHREGTILPVFVALILPMDDAWIVQSAGLHKHKVMQCLNHCGLTLVS